jgi:hypothetical protein
MFGGEHPRFVKVCAHVLLYGGAVNGSFGYLLKLLTVRFAAGDPWGARAAGALRSARIANALRCAHAASVLNS